MATTLLPFAQLPGEVLMDRRLTPTHIRVLIALYMHRNKKHEKVWPHRETLALLTGLHVSKISRATTELEALGWVTKTGKGGRSSPCSYRVHVPDHVTSDLDVTVDENGAINVPQTVAESKTVSDVETVANSETVSESETVSDLARNGSRIGHQTVAESDRGKEQTKNRPEQTIVGGQAAKPKKRREKLPENFRPNETGLKRATDAGLDVAEELQMFRDHHIAKGSLMLDWQAAWRTWVGNAKKWNNGAKKSTKNGFGGIPGIPGIDDVDPKPQWALDAGFTNIWEAQNADCNSRNAHEFRNGRRVSQ